MGISTDTLECGCVAWALYAGDNPINGGELIDTGVDVCDVHYALTAIHESALDIIHSLWTPGPPMLVGIVPWPVESPALIAMVGKEKAEKREDEILAHFF